MLHSCWSSTRSWQALSMELQPPTSLLVGSMSLRGFWPFCCWDVPVSWGIRFVRAVLTWVHSSSIETRQSHKGCVMAGLVVGSDSKKTSPSKLQALGPSINIMDKWARVYLARLCAALLYADWSSTAEFAKGPGAPFWRMLTLLATRCITKPASLS
jgi:hypothetical protein